MGICAVEEHDVFISYSSIDIEFADRIRELLQSKGVSCWMAPDSITYGDDYTSSIPYGIGNCRVFILLLSEHSMQSEWVPKELDSAISIKKKIIPFKIDDSMLSMSFSFCLVNVHRIEAFSRFDEACEELVHVVRSALAEQTEDPEERRLPVSGRAPVLRSEYPYIRSRSTIGRAGVLSRISECFQEDNIVVLWGIGGIGKSKVAKKYLEDALASKQYQTTVWLNYKGSMKDTLLNLPFDYLDEERFLADRKRFCRNDTFDAVNELAKYKRRLLMAYGAETLLIIDGIDELDGEDIALLDAVRCRFLLVSRTRSDFFPSVEVSELAREDIRKVFFSFYEDGDPEDAGEVQSADRLIEAVGRHTLTVKMLALYAQLTGTPLDEIYQELKAGARELYSESVRDESGKALSLDQQMNCLFNISDLNPAQRTILARLSVFPFSGVKKYTFKKLCPESLMLDVDALVKMGWVKSEKGMLSIHPLVAHCVHRVSQNLMDDCAPMIERFLSTLVLTGIDSVLFQENNKTVLKTMLNYLDCSTLTGVRLYTAAGIFLNALAYQHMIVGDTDADPSFFTQKVNVGEESMEEYAEAVKYLLAAERAYSERFAGEDEVLRSDIYDGLGACCFNRNEFSKSRAYHLAAYELRRNLLPEGDVKRITSARRRALAGFYSGETASAEREFEENLEELIRLFEGSETPSELVELAKGHSYVGRIKLHHGHAAEAEPHLRSALALLERAGTDETGRQEVEALLRRMG